jgi:4-hydroxybenzoate polyprenyltransferase
MLGVVVAALAQRTLPAVLVFAAMRYWDWAAVALCLLSTIIGIRYILIHQILDEEGDRRSGVTTVATVHGGNRLRLVVKRCLLPLEVGVAALTVALIAISHWLLLPVSLAYLLWVLAQYAVLRAGAEGPGFSIESYNKVLEDYYGLYLPLTLAVLLAVEDGAFWSVVVFTLAWRARLIGRELRHLREVGGRLLKAA